MRASRVPRPAELGRRPVVGVLALQGDFAKHVGALRLAGAEAIAVRSGTELDAIDALVIPGGESTTLLRLIETTGLRKRLRSLLKEKPALGTCAGLILMAKELSGGGKVPFPPLGVLDVEVERNAYGRQIDSFQAPVKLDSLGGQQFEGVFIRAPRIRRVGRDLEVIATRNGEPVGVRQGSLMGLCFHPELTGDTRLHRYFLAACCGQPLD